MSENLILRVKRLISGSVNETVDAIEAAVPETTMREAIREIDRTIDEITSTLRQTRSEQHQAARRIELTTEKIGRIAENVTTALSNNREDLAEAAVSRQLDLEAQIPVMEETIKSASERTSELEGYISALRGRKAEMEAELEVFVQAKKELSGEAFVANSEQHDSKHEVRVEKAEQAFDRALKNASGVSGLARSDRETTSKLVELQTLERKQKVSERLAKYKKDLSPKKKAKAS